MKKKIIIAGGSGFIGQCLATYFKAKGYESVVLSRKPKKPGEVYWDGKNLGAWASELEGAEALINLSGKSVDCRYTPKNKKAILDSRLESTAVLQKAVEGLSKPPKVWLNASTATIYIHSETQAMTEEKGIVGDDFSMNIAKQWEACFFKDELPETRKVALRISIVLGKKGGAFPKMRVLTRLGMGGHQGNGEQYISWIHEEDLCHAVDWIIEKPEITGSVNLSAPKPLRNNQFMCFLRDALDMPFGFSQNVLLLELGAWLMQTETELLLKSRNVYPEKLLQNGFRFTYRDAESAILELCK